MCIFCCTFAAEMTNQSLYDIILPLAIADDVYKTHAICVHCGNLAYVSHRTVSSDKRVLLGETESYEPLCRACYEKALEAEKTNN